MRITLLALGTRGDVQPMLALGKGLRAAGHEITLIAGSNFEAWVRGYGFGFRPSLDMEALMKSPAGIAWVEEPNPFRQVRHMKALLKPHGREMIEPLITQAENTDLLVSGFVSEPFAQSASEKFGVAQLNTSLQVYHATASGWASMTAVVKGNSPVNRWMGKIGERLVWDVAAGTVNEMRRTLGLAPHNAASYYRAARQIPTLYGFSRHVVPPATDWRANEQIAGYWFLDEQQDYQPAESLRDFLSAGTPPIYIGFGSMSSSAPQQTIDLVMAALQQTGQRAVIAQGWSGAEADHSELVYFVDKVPHDWLFERAAAVIHHGGAGTTGAGLRAGKPTLIIPHMSDQPFWAKRVYELGVGAEPIPRHKLTVGKLAAGIERLVSDAEMQRAAAELGEKIRAEDGVENAVRYINEMAR